MLEPFVISENSSLYEALKKINENKKKFLIVTEGNNEVLGTLTDGDIRRGIIRFESLYNSICDVYNKMYAYVNDNDSFSKIIDIFKDSSIDFLPIVNSRKQLVNIISKKNMHNILLQNLQYTPNSDFLCMEDSALEYEIYQRPWGIYKTTIMNELYQAKIIIVNPHESLSYQKHLQREEHWLIISGKGLVQLEDSVFDATKGMHVFIPKGCKHRVSNTSSKCLIISEVQLGAYFGEDDIIRYNDLYGRK